MSTNTSSSTYNAPSTSSGKRVTWLLHDNPSSQPENKPPPPDSQLTSTAVLDAQGTPLVETVEEDDDDTVSTAEEVLIYLGAVSMDTTTWAPAMDIYNEDEPQASTEAPIHSIKDRPSDLGEK